MFASAQQQGCAAGRSGWQPLLIVSLVGLAARGPNRLQLGSQRCFVAHPSSMLHHHDFSEFELCVWPAAGKNDGKAAGPQAGKSWAPGLWGVHEEDWTSSYCDAEEALPSIIKQNVHTGTPPWDAHPLVTWR